MRSNAAVGPPIELLYYAADALQEPTRYHIFKENDPYLIALRRAWDANIRKGFDDLPPLNAVFAAEQ